MRLTIRGSMRCIRSSYLRPERAEGDGEIHVHTRLNELGGDETARLACGKPFADELQLFLAMRRAEPGGEVKTILHRQQAEDLASVSGDIDDAKGLRLRVEFRSYFRPGESVVLTGQFDARATQGFRHRARIRGGFHWLPAVGQCGLR